MVPDLIEGQPPRKMNMNDCLKKYLRFLIPGLFGVVLLSAYIFADGFVIGNKMGAIALGAMGICTPVMTFGYAIGFMFGMGGATLFAIEVGRGNEEKARKLFSTALISALLLGIVLAVVTNVFDYEIAYFLGADEGNIEYAIPYLKCLFYYIPGFFASGVFSAFMLNEGHPNISLVSQILSNLMNVVLDFLFVYGFEWGMFGAAFASVFCNFIAILVNLISSYAFKMRIRFSIRFVDFKVLKDILRNGFPSLVSESANGIITFAYIFNATSLYGTEGASIYTIIMNWALIFVNVMAGIGRAVQPLLSLSYGAENEKNVKIYRNYALKTVCIAAVMVMAVCYGFTKPLVSLFGSDNEKVLEMTNYAFRLYAAGFLVMGFGIAGATYFQAVNMAKEASVLQLSRGIVLPLLLSFAGASFLGKNGLWLSMPVSELVTAVAAIIFIFRKEIRF